MSRLTELLRRAHEADPELGKDLKAEVDALMKRRTFGLVFEQHEPEAVELPGRAPRRGDKVRVLPPRGQIKSGDERLWRVERIERADGGKVAHLLEIGPKEPQEQAVLVEDLVVVAEFDDRIYPGLVETGRVERGGPDRPFHSVINAENFHALEMLTYTHRHSVDCIYIDPPYNTGAKDWKYNNNYVASDDDYRHSKWLAFMERRLLVAKELLNPEDSVLIVTIDEKEYLRLGMLLSQVFPEAHTQMVTIVINPNGVARDHEMSRVEEYAFFVYLGSAGPAMLDDDFLRPPAAEAAGGISHSQRANVRWERLMRGGSNSARSHSPGCFYPVYVDPETRSIAHVGNPLDVTAPRDSAPSIEGLVTVMPVGKTHGDDKVWQMSPDNLRILVESGHAKVGAYDAKNDRWSLLYLGRNQRNRIERGELIVTGRDSNGVLEVEEVEGRVVLRAPKTVWMRQAHSAGEYGSRMIRALMPDRKFPFPKSLYAVEDALRAIVKDKPDATILDFFSGSGTTAHAVMRLNKQDGGRRQCISVTNNEVSAEEQKRLRKENLRPGDPDWEALGICDYVTKPRIRAAITGRTPQGDPIKGDYRFTDEFPMSEGFEENAVFFTLTYEAPLSVRHDRAFAKIAPMLWLRAGSQGHIITDLGEQGWDVAQSYGVLRDMDALAEFAAAVESSESVGTVFLVTDSDSAFQSACRDLPERVTTVRLYESYLTNFTINRRARA